MRIGLALPADARLVAEWARRAEAAGFDFLAAEGPDAFTPLAAAAAVTERIGLVALGPEAGSHNPALLAKQAATLDGLSSGRFRTGLGGRADAAAVHRLGDETPGDVRELIRSYAKAGCDDLVLVPAGAGLDQVDRLAAALPS